MAFTVRPAALAAVLLVASTPAVAQNAAPVATSAASPAAMPPATPAAAPIAQTPLAPASAAERTWALSAAAGVSLPGTVNVDGNGNDSDAGFNLRAAADFFVSQRLSMGVYVQYIGFQVGKTTKYDATMTAIGGTLVGRFGQPQNPHFRAGIGLAYQTETVDISGVSSPHGFGISPFVEAVYPVQNAAFFAHVGFNAQPSGGTSGNNSVDVTWGPIWELMVGAEFGR
jgi:hypothetical protein